MPIPEEVVKCYKYIDSHVKDYVDELKEIVRVPNISSDADAKKPINDLIKWMSDKLKSLGFTILLKRPEGKKFQVTKYFD